LTISLLPPSRRSAPSKGQAAAAQTGVKDLGKTAVMFAEQNVGNSVEFAHRLVHPIALGLGHENGKRTKG
jgi:hypothetical protein